MAEHPTKSRTVSLTDNLGPLHIAVLEKFIPQFAQRAKVLFLRGKDGRPVIFVSGSLQHIGVPIENIDKLPDMVLYLSKRRLLILLELSAPITLKQRNQFERLLVECSARREYVSALSDWRAFSRAGCSFAWNTHVWLAEAPDHMIHCNGEKFLGPRRRYK